MRREHWNLNREERIGTKAFICWMGVVLLLILFLGKILFSLFPEENEKEAEPEHIPVIEILKNVWIMDAGEADIKIFREGMEESYSCAENVFIYIPGEVREQIADITLTDGEVTEIHLKTDKINGKILSADENGIEVEGYGRLELAKDYKGYRIYQTLAMCTYRDIYFGYDFTDLVLEDGKICALLLAKEEAMESIRVLIKNADYGGIFHEKIVFTADTDFVLCYGTSDAPMEERFRAGDVIEIEEESPYFIGDRVTVVPDVLTGKVILQSVTRSQGTPKYRGKIELLKTAEGLVVVNEVLLEEYLYCVVPSEMPASYPEEALMAQAICARTYAYGRMCRAGYPQYGAHVDDSTSYQVYNNILEQESTTTAVKETYGQLLFTDEGQCVETFYYSTSCGVGSDANVWKTEAAKAITYLPAMALNRGTMQSQIQAAEAETEGTAEEANATENLELENPGESLRQEEVFRKYITEKHADDFEVAESWYRWTYQVKKLDVEYLYEVLASRYQVNEKLILTLQDGEYVSKPIESFAVIKDMYIAKRGAGGVADELIIETDTQTYKVITEHNIRYVLNDGKSKILRQDGSEVSSTSILPSAFFVLDTGREKENVVGYTLTGGGFGHGVGMSQNGAKAMAQSGYTAEHILQFFYRNCSIVNIYESKTQ